MEYPEAPFRLHYGDLTDGTGLRRVLEVAQPDEVYNLGAQSHVKVSFSQPEYTADAVGLRYSAPARSHPRPLSKLVAARNPDVPGWQF